MPTTTNLSLTYPTPLDPAYTDIWGDILNDIFIALDANTGYEQIPGLFDFVSDGTYKLCVKMRHPGAITSITTICESGSCTATFKINNSALGGTANSVSTSEQSQPHSTSNTFVAGDDISVTISSTSACRKLSFNIYYTRTGAGTPP